MPMPKSVTKIKKDGIEFISNVDACQYTITELSRAALRDVAKFVRKQMILELKKLPGMKRSKRPYKSTQYWVRRRETDLQIGFKHNSWYGVLQELGSKNQPKRDILRNSVYRNINKIREIESKYLSGIDNPSLIDESEFKSPEGEEL
jgi:HK97 gp10 family phage protein